MEFATETPSTRRVAAVSIVALLHLGIVYALMNGLGHQVVEVLRAPLETRLIDEVKPAPKEHRALPPPKLVPPPPPAFVPPPDIRVLQPAAQGAITTVTHEKPVEPPPPPPPPKVAEPVRVPAVIDPKGCQPPEYPAVSRRLEETGAVVLQFLVDTDGRVTQSKVETSSGFTRLDEAAREALSKCQFKPGTLDGKPVQSWARFRYVWKID